jgi:hypothetical protein
MENMARDFFQDLYAKDENINPDIITGLLDRCITDNMNADLCAPFSEKEISDALFQIGPRA